VIGYVTAMWAKGSAQSPWRGLGSTMMIAEVGSDLRPAGGHGRATGWCGSKRWSAMSNILPGDRHGNYQVIGHRAHAAA